MPPPPIVIDHFIPKNRTTSVALQIARFSSLDLNPGPAFPEGKPLDLLNLAITASAVIDTIPGDPQAPLRRRVTLDAVEPAFDDAFGILEDPAAWKLVTLFQELIEQELATTCTVALAP